MFYLMFASIYLLLNVIEIGIPILLAIIITCGCIKIYHRLLLILDIPLANADNPADSRSAPVSELSPGAMIVLFLFIFCSTMAVYYSTLRFILGSPAFQLWIFLIDQLFMSDFGWDILVDLSYYAFKGFWPIFGICATSFVVGAVGKSLLIFLRSSGLGDSHMSLLNVIRHHTLHTQIETLAAMYFGIINIGCTMLYYSCIYNEEGTFKPPWTETLG